jgi:hypothetical protein
MPVGRLPYEKPTIVIHWVDTAYLELHDVAITHVTVSQPMKGYWSIDKLAKAIIRVARETRVAPMAVDRMRGLDNAISGGAVWPEQSFIMLCPMTTGSPAIHGVA